MNRRMKTSRSTGGRSAAASRSVSDVVGVKVVVFAIQVYLNGVIAQR